MARILRSEIESTEGAQAADAYETLAEILAAREAAGQGGMTLPAAFAAQLAQSLRKQPYAPQPRMLSAAPGAQDLEEILFPDELPA